MSDRFKHYIIGLWNSICDTLNVPNNKYRFIIGGPVIFAIIIIPILSLSKCADTSVPHVDDSIKTDSIKADSSFVVVDDSASKLSDWYENIEDAYPEYPFYPIPVDMKNINVVGEWTFFIHDITVDSSSERFTYPALFKYKNNESAIRVSPRACYNYQVAQNSVFYMDSITMIQDHGILYVSRPDGKNERLLDEDLYSFQLINDEYIYYLFRHDTLGVGLEGHALYRMNLDGTNKMIAAYEVSGAGFGCSHFDYHVKDDWVYGDTFRIQLGNPANGFEKVELLIDIENIEDDWIYYVTNRLIKARKDGSEQIELDGIDSYHYEINSIDEYWIYYTKGGVDYKIKKDGTNKTNA